MNLTDRKEGDRMRDYNTRFAIRFEKNGTYEFVRDGRRVCIYSMREAMRIRNELKAQGYNVALMPYCE